MFNQAFILLITISFLDLALGLFVYLKNPKEKMNTSFGLLSIFILIWINASFFEDEVRNTAYMFALLKLDFSSAMFASFFVLRFCSDLAKTEISNIKHARAWMLIVPAIFTALIFSTESILSGYEILQGVITPVLGFAYPLYALLIALTLIMGVGTLIWKYRHVSMEEKAKYIYLFIGFTLTSTIAFASNILFADYIQGLPNYGLYSRLGLFSTIFVILFSGYAIVKHRLLNLKIITTELLSLGILITGLFQCLKSGSVSDLLTNGIIFAITLALVILLVRSVENEVRRKEELQVLSKKLAGANKKLIELDAARAEFMSFASHQLRTPLTSIKGFSSLLLEKSSGDLTASQEDMVSKIAVSSERMVQLAEDYLNLSRIESGKLDFTFNKWRVENICQEVIDTLELKAKEKNLSLEFNHPNELLPEVEIDGHKVREVISNLVDNAIKYTPSGSVTVSIAESKNEQTDCIRITVADTGMGIAASDIPKLFAKFSRVKDEQHLTVKGTGLGLYVGKNMIEGNGGKIWVESDGIGMGSRFIVEIPVAQETEQVKTSWGGSDTRSAS